MLERSARGCPRCARNIEAEDMIDRFIWRRLAPALLVIIFVAIALVYLFR